MWWQSTNSPRAPEEDPADYALELIATFVTIGTAVALAAAVVAWWIARHAVGRDGAERVLALETTSLHGSRDRWGAAMRAELASIDDPVQRGRFARSAAVLAFRRGTGRWPVCSPYSPASARGRGVHAARISFDRPRDRGIIGEPIMGLVVLLLVAAVIAGTLIGRSFRAGLETAVLAWLAVYVCTVAVEVPQAIAWYNDEGSCCWTAREPRARESMRSAPRSSPSLISRTSSCPCRCSSSRCWPPRSAPWHCALARRFRMIPDTDTPAPA